MKRDVMRQRYFERQFGPSYVYIRYRCSYCKKLGECFIPREEWSVKLLNEITSETTEVELQHFSSLGPITFSEMRTFRHELEHMNALPTRPDED